MWAIKHESATDYETGQPLYWSDEDGWVSEESATMYAIEDRMRPQYLPLGSIWEERP